MKIAVICANGKEGKLIVEEAIARGQTLQPLCVAKISRQQQTSFSREFLL